MTPENHFPKSIEPEILFAVDLAKINELHKIVALYLKSNTVFLAAEIIIFAFLHKFVLQSWSVIKSIRI